MHIFKVKLPFYPPYEVKCKLQNEVSTIGWLKGSGSGLHSGGCILPLHGHCGQTLTSYLGCYFFNLHQKVKDPLGDRIEELVGNQSMTRQCLMSPILYQPAVESSALVKEGLQQSKSPKLPTNGPAEKAKCEDLEKFVIGDDPKKFFQVGAQLPPQEKRELVVFLKRNVDILLRMLTKLLGWIRASSATI